MKTATINPDRVKELLESNPPTFIESLGCAISIFIIPNTDPYMLFLRNPDELMAHLLDTRKNIVSLYNNGVFYQDQAITLYYPELWITIKKQQQFAERIHPAASSIKSLSVITNSQLMSLGWPSGVIKKVEL